MYAQIGISKQQDEKSIEVDSVACSSYKHIDRSLSGSYLFKDGCILNFLRVNSDHPGLYAQKFIPGDHYDIANYRKQIYRFLELVLSKKDFEIVKTKLNIDKFNNYTEFSLNHPDYSEFVISVRIDPHGMNIFLSYYGVL